VEGGRLKDLKDDGLTNFFFIMGPYVCTQEENEDNMYLDN
jgi:hypothetical protein